MHPVMAIDSTWMAGFLLLTLRVSAVFLMTPVLYTVSVPLTARVLFVLGISGALSAGLPAGMMAVSTSASITAHVGTLLAACLSELALGATLALGVMLAFAAFSIAGQLLGVQIGFGLGQVIDPSSNAVVPAVASGFTMVALLVFFLGDGHHVLLRGIAYCLERFPLGHGWPVGAAVGPIFKQVSGLFTLGFALAAPVVFCIAMLEMALGVVARNLPQINMLTMGIPVKIIAGLLALSLWFGGMGGVMGRVYSSIYRSWDAFFSASCPSLAPELMARGLGEAATQSRGEGC